MSSLIDVVIVDDEPDVRGLLQDYLSLQGFQVRAAGNADELDRRLAERAPDVVVLDVNMPGENGVEALARLRKAGLQVGVILLTAQGSLADRLGGLATGADDYVVKPFEPRELLARIRAVLRRSAGAPAPPAPRAPVQMGRCVLDRDARCLRDTTGAPIELTAMEFDLLDVFARHPRQTLSRQRLSELAHGRGLVPGDRSIDLRILRLRKKLEIDPASPRALRTVHSEGYRFDPEAS